MLQKYVQDTILYSFSTNTLKHAFKIFFAQKMEQKDPERNEAILPEQRAGPWALDPKPWVPIHPSYEGNFSIIFNISFSFKFLELPLKSPQIASQRISVLLRCCRCAGELLSQLHNSPFCTHCSLLTSSFSPTLFWKAWEQGSSQPRRPRLAGPPCESRASYISASRVWFCPTTTATKVLWRAGGLHTPAGALTFNCAVPQFSSLLKGLIF